MEKQMKDKVKVNVGRNSYGMNNVIMEYVESVGDFDYWSCSGCCHDDETISFYNKSEVGKNYGLRCDCCGAGQVDRF
tara:strand:+ start:121 stop:351 length:231 start_codon:yes stop_codon:yes gene_type:complete